MLKQKLEQKIEGRLGALSDTARQLVENANEILSTIETISYLTYLKDNIEKGTNEE